MKREKESGWTVVVLVYLSRAVVLKLYLEPRSVMAPLSRERLIQRPPDRLPMSMGKGETTWPAGHTEPTLHEDLVSGSLEGSVGEDTGAEERRVIGQMLCL